MNRVFWILIIALGLSPLLILGLTLFSPEDPEGVSLVAEESQAPSMHDFPTYSEVVSRTVVEPSPTDRPGLNEDVPLTIEFIDEQNGEPIPQLPYFAYLEGRNRVVARGRSDVQGIARIEVVPPDSTIVVLTERLLPYAATQSAVWMGKLDRVTLRVSVTPGYSVRGRVVDDEGTPIDGAVIRVKTPSDLSNALSRSESLGYVVATTNSEGRYEASGLSSLQKGIWIIEGRPKAEQDLGFTLTASILGVVMVERRIESEELQELIDVPDMVVKRRHFINAHGLVVDSEGLPIEGALVSFNQLRKQSRMYGDWGTMLNRDPYLDSPSDPDFRLFPGETLSEKDGRFNVDVLWDEESPRALVWTEDGRVSWITQEHIEVLAKGELIVVEISNRSVITLDVRGPGDQSVALGSAEEIERRINSTRASLGASGFDSRPFANGIVVRILLDDGTIEFVRSMPHGDGRYRVESPSSLYSIRELEFACQGFHPVLQRFEYGLESTNLIVNMRPHRPESLSVSLNLEGCPSFQFGVPQPRIQISVFGRNPSDEMGVPVGHASLQVYDGKRACEILVPALPRYWLQVYGSILSDSGESAPFHFGPFAKGEKIVLPSFEFVNEAKEKWKPPSIQDRLRRVVSDEAIPYYLGVIARAQGTLSYRLIDGETRKPISFWVACSATPRGMGEEYRAKVTGQCETKQRSVSEGDWSVSLSVDGYETKVLESVVINAGEHTDLGDVAMTSKPRWEGRIEGWKEGEADVFRIRSRDFSIDEDGVFSFVDPEGPVHLGIRGRLSRDTRAISLLSFNTLEIPKGTSFPLPQFNDVEIRIESSDPLYSELNWGIRIDSAIGGGSDRGIEIGPMEDGTRRFRFRLGAGNYTFKGTNAVEVLEPLSIEVKDLPGLQVFSWTIQ